MWVKIKIVREMKMNPNRNRNLTVRGEHGTARSLLPDLTLLYGSVHVRGQVASLVDDVVGTAQLQLVQVAHLLLSVNYYSYNS